MRTKTAASSSIELILENVIGSGDMKLDGADFVGESEKITAFLEEFIDRNQGFQLLPKAKALLLSVKHLAERVQKRIDRGEIKDVVILGIGGSALGITCLRDALKGMTWNFHGKPRVFVLDNLDLVDEVEPILEMNKTLFVVISKSGGTLETMEQYEYFSKKAPQENFVFITDPAKGRLRKLGKELGVPMLEVPENVGGRFSVLSPVGLFPAALMGIDIESLLDGAEEMTRSFYSKDFYKNIPFQVAALQYLFEWQHGVHITVMMPYSTRLFSFADWYRQLLAESLGKDGKGITPVNALGVTDQHSQVQLYNEGPNDKLIFFLEVEDLGVKFEHLMNVEKQATEKALTQYKKPNVTLKIPRIDEYNLGKLFMLFECSIAFLGEYYRINAFDQPGVELGKKLTEELLKGRLPS